jgi:hypothetical protein
MFALSVTAVLAGPRHVPASGGEKTDVSPGVVAGPGVGGGRKHSVREALEVHREKLRAECSKKS